MAIDPRFLLVLAGLAIVVLLVGLILWRKRQVAVPRKQLHEIAKDQDVHVPHRFVNKVVSYIDASLGLGYSTQDIYDHLRSLGWTEDRINDSFRRFKLLGTYHEMKQNNLPDHEIMDALAKEYQPQQIEDALNHHTAIIGKDATPEDQMAHLEQLAKNHAIEQGKAIPAKLATFISACYDHGYRREIIQQLLLQKGYSPENIEKACAGLTK